MRVLGPNAGVQVQGLSSLFTSRLWSLMRGGSTAAAAQEEEEQMGSASSHGTVHSLEGHRPQQDPPSLVFKRSAFTAIQPLLLTEFLRVKGQQCLPCGEKGLMREVTP